MVMAACLRIALSVPSGISPGWFANGAVAGAFSRAFNDEIDKNPAKPVVQKIKPTHPGQAHEPNYLRTESRQEQIVYPGHAVGDILATGLQVGGAVLGSPSTGLSGILCL